MVDTRTKWLTLMRKIADPVLLNLADGKLHRNLPQTKADRVMYSHLEAFARTLTGIAPWIESGLDCADKYGELARQCIDNATSPTSPDRMNFTKGYGQSLVDAAFLAHAIVRAPRELYFELPDAVKHNLINSLVATRKFTPPQTNWLFFSAMIECALKVTQNGYNLYPVTDAIRAFENFYKGDGAYGDGTNFSFDYYNSFVIYPMYTDILREFAPVNDEAARLLPLVTKRAARYAQVLEKLIAPDGSYPIVGRSVCYRFGAFHALAQAVYRQYLPDNLSYAQVRCALDAVIDRTVKTDIFDGSGFLKTGVVGSQPSLGEFYISVGSLYLCSTVFLPLALPPSHPFWSESDCDYSGKAVWSGCDLNCDHAIDF